MYKNGHKVKAYLWVNEAWEILILEILTILIFSMFVVLWFFFCCFISVDFVPSVIFVFLCCVHYLNIISSVSLAIRTLKISYCIISKMFSLELIEICLVKYCYWYHKVNFKKKNADINKIYFFKRHVSLIIVNAWLIMLRYFPIITRSIHMETAVSDFFHNWSVFSKLHSKMTSLKFSY
jgi:hypothetical protein